jgi:hypothetical protein
MKAKTTESEPTSQESMQTELFVGYLLTPEIRMHLHASPQWKQAQIVPCEEDLKEIHSKDKTYLGTFIGELEPDLKKLKALHTKNAERLAFYCPELKVSSLKGCIFPQLFLQ